MRNRNHEKFSKKIESIRGTLEGIRRIVGMIVVLQALLYQWQREQGPNPFSFRNSVGGGSTVFASF